MNVVLPDASVRLLLMIKVAKRIADANPPPKFTVTAAPEMTACAISLPPETVTGEPLKLPLMSNVPLFTVVAPVCVLAPVNVHVPVPSLMSETAF